MSSVCLAPMRAAVLVLYEVWGLAENRKAKPHALLTAKWKYFHGFFNIYRWRIYLWNVSYASRKTAHLKRIKQRSFVCVAARIKFKTLMLAYRTTTGSAPAYFHSLLRINIPSRSLRSASERRLVVPSQRGSKSLSRTFSFTIPGWWNDLPSPIRNAGSLSIFKQQLKTHLFRHYLTTS